MDKQTKKFVLLALLVGMLFSIPVTQQLNTVEEEVTNVTSSLWLYDVWDSNTVAGNTNITFEQVYVDDIDSYIKPEATSDYGYWIDSDLDFFSNQYVPANSVKKIYIKQNDKFSPNDEGIYLAKFTGSQGDWNVRNDDSTGDYVFGSNLRVYRIPDDNYNYVYQNINLSGKNTLTQYRIKPSSYYSTSGFAVGTVADEINDFRRVDNAYAEEFYFGDSGTATIKNETSYHRGNNIGDIYDESGNWLYVDRYRYGDNVTTEVYYDEARTNLFGSKSTVIHEFNDTNLNYVYLHQNRRDGSNGWASCYIDDFYIREYNPNVTVTVNNVTGGYEVVINNTGSTDVEFPIQVDGDKLGITSQSDGLSVNNELNPEREVTIETKLSSDTFTFTNLTEKNKLIQINGNLSAINMTSDVPFNYTLDITYIKERVKEPLDHNVTTN